MLSKYTIDSKDTLVEINDGFCQFGQENGGMDFDPQAWLGEDLLRVIHGDSTRLYYEALFTHLRISKKEREICYRCDSPTEARFMRMTMRSDKDYNIYFVNEIEAVTPFLQPINLKFYGKGII
ncbi:MAG: hypothetical protein AAF696_08150, partial [Bacteroidota bacterium]